MVDFVSSSSIRDTVEACVLATWSTITTSESMALMVIRESISSVVLDDAVDKFEVSSFREIVQTHEYPPSTVRPHSGRTGRLTHQRCRRSHPYPRHLYTESLHYLPSL